MSKEKIKVLQLFDKKNPNELDFIFQDGGYCYIWKSEEGGHIRVSHYQDRIEETTDLTDIISELAEGNMYETDFDGESKVRKEKIDNEVLEEALPWHFGGTTLEDFEIVKIKHSKKDEEHIKAFLILCGNFNFDDNDEDEDENYD